MGRLLRTTFVVALAALGLAQAGDAKTFPLTFDRTTAQVGDRVTVFVSVPERGVPVFVVDVRDVRNVRRFLPKDRG